MEYYSSQGLKRAAKQKTAYQPGIAKGAFLLLVAILFGFFMLLSIALSGTVLQPLANMPFFVDPTADLNDLEQMLELVMTPKYMAISQLIMAIFGSLATTILTGYCYICLKISRAQKASLMDLFFVFRNNPDRVILLYLLGFVIQLIISLPSIAVSYFSLKLPDNVPLYLLERVLSLGTLVFVMIFNLMVSQVLFLYLDDPDKSVPDVFRESIELTRGHKARLFGLLASFLGWLALSVMTLGVLLIWLAPYMTTTLAEFYRNLKKEPLYVKTQDFPGAEV